MEASSHIPVLTKEVLNIFKHNLAGEKLRFFDGTLGGAGHTGAILNAFANSCVVADCVKIHCPNENLLVPIHG